MTSVLAQLSASMTTRAAGVIFTIRAELFLGIHLSLSLFGNIGNTENPLSLIHAVVKPGG
jgi:hypothetical protein